MNLGELIQQYISKHRMSYREFAALSDLSAGYISMLINNRNPKSGRPPIPTIRTYNGIAKAMNITADELLSMMDDAPIEFNKHMPTPEEEDRIWAKREQLRRDPRRRILFDLAENGTEKDIDAAVALIDALKKTNPDFYDGDDPA